MIFGCEYDANPRVSDFATAKKKMSRMGRTASKLSRKPSFVGGALAVGVVVLGGALLWSRSASAKSALPYTPGGTEPETDWQAEIRDVAAPLIKVTGWTGLDDYLVVVAYTESRGHKTAGSKKIGKNAARGWFGMRPKSGLVGSLKGKPGDLLLDPRVAVAAAADYAWRLSDEAFRGSKSRGEMPWGAIRRGWALPSLVKDYSWSKLRSRDVLGRMKTSEQKTGLVGLHTAMAFPPGMHWVGIDEALKLVGWRG